MKYPARVPERAGGVGEQRGEPLHPPVHGYGVDGDAALGQQLLDTMVLWIVKWRGGR